MTATCVQIEFTLRCSAERYHAIAEEAAARVLAMVEAGAVITAGGKHLPTPIRSICVHGDSDHAVATASRVRGRLEQAGIALKPFRAIAT